jgi:DNA-binding CsgD family transcriptional regulator
MVLGRTEGLITANARAEKLMNDGFFIQQRQLRASSNIHQVKLDALLLAAFDEPMSISSCVALPRPSRKRPLVVQAVPLAAQWSPGLRQKVAASILVLLFDLELENGASQSHGLKALGLTPAEVNVALLVGAGVSPRDASDHLEISILTVRSHLKSIFQKLGLTRQGDLVQLVSRLRMVR